MTSILETNDETNNGKNGKEDGVSTTIFTIVTVGILLAILIGVFYVNVMDRLNATDAYRMTETRRQRDDYKGDCEENFSGYDALIKWNENQGHKPPPEITRLKPCNTVESAEKNNH